MLNADLEKDPGLSARNGSVNSAAFIKQKDTIFSGGQMGKRLILFVGYLMFSFIFSFISLGGGDGNSAPMEVFFSWGLLFAFISNYNKVGELLSYPAYLSILFIVTFFLGRQKKVRGDLVLICFYLSGSFIVALIAGRTPDTPLFAYLFFFAFSVGVVIIYLAIDWRLARGGNQPSSASPKSLPFQSSRRE